MALTLKLKTASTIDVVTLAEIKTQCHVDHSDDDAYLVSLVAAAVSHLETRNGILGVALGNQVWELYADYFPCDALKIPLPPIFSVDEVAYIDPVTSAYVVWPTINYQVDDKAFHGWVKPVNSWPEPKDAMNAVRVTFTAGFGVSNDKIPASLRHAVKILAAHWYENREAVVVGMTSQNMEYALLPLISQWREWSL